MLFSFASPSRGKIIILWIAYCEICFDFRYVMANSNGSYRDKADIFFPWLLFFSLFSTLALVWWQVDNPKIIHVWRGVESWSTKNYLVSILKPYLLRITQQSGQIIKIYFAKYVIVS